MTNLDDLKTRLKIAKSKLQKKNLEKDDKKKGVFLGTGFILDNWFDTKPILIIIFFLFGAAAGITNVFRAAKRMQEQED